MHKDDPFIENIIKNKVEWERIECIAKSISDINYEVSGSKNTPQHTFFKDAKQQKIGRNVTATFSYSIFSKITSPKGWKGYNCEIRVNTDSSDHIDKAADGYIGDGWLENKIVLLRLFVQPNIARDILDQYIYFSKLNDDSDDCFFRFLLSNFKYGDGILKGAFTYRVENLWIQKSPMDSMPPYE